MKILVLIALKEEFDITTNNYKDWVNHGEYYQKDHIYLAYTGVGKVNGAIVTTKLSQIIKPDFIINIGSTCAINKKLKQFDIVQVKATQYLDFDLSQFGYQTNQIPHFDKLLLIANDPIIKSITNALNIKDEVVQGTVDQFVDQSSFSKIKELNKVDTVDMELCGIAHAANLLNLKWFSIKIISDLLGDDKANVVSYNDALPTIRKIIGEILITLSMINKNNI